MAPDLDDDTGDWTADDYARSAQALFGAHPHFGDTAHTRALAEGDRALGDEALANALAHEAMAHAAGAGALRFYHRGDAIVARGVLAVGSVDELDRLRAAMPRVRFDDVRLTQSKRTRTRGTAPVKGAVPPLPEALRTNGGAPRVDMRPQCSPVGDQGQTLRCDAFSWTHAAELAGNLLGTPFPRLSCSYTMLQFLKRQGERVDYHRAYTGGDGVSGTWQPGELLVRHGTCRATMWENDEPHPKASLDAMENDAPHHVLDAKAFVIHLDDAKRALRRGWPVQLSMYIGDAFDQIGRDGVYRMPEVPSPRREYHAMLCVGYIGNFFIIKNSWGRGWGDGGYAYVPKGSVARSEPELVALALDPDRNEPGRRRPGTRRTE
jgi:Papain family cysteine protease